MAQGQQDLVPRNLPYGGRQQYVEAAGAAGVPLSSRTPAVPPMPGGAGPRGTSPNQIITPDMDIFDFGAPGDFSGVDLSPEGRQAATETEMTRLAVESPNPLVRAIAATYLRRRQGSGA